MNEGVVAVTQLVADDDNDSLTSDHTSVVVVEEGGGAVTVELPDGTQAIVHNAISDGQQESMEGVAFQLDDGRIGYLYGSTLFQTVPQQEEPYVISCDGKYLCSYVNCDAAYHTVNLLKNHQRSHTKQRPYPPHECEACKKCFSTGYALKSHLRTHTGEKPYQCPEEQCGKCFKTSGDLQKHVRTHTGERPFKCQVCEKSFTTSNIRKVHMRVHTGEKPYQCNHEGCGRKFASATNFRNHCRIHTGEKPYVCSVENCGKRFTEYSSLYKHHMVHNQQKRHCCYQCGRFYRQLSTLAVHKRTVHNTTVENEEVMWVRQELDMDLLTEEQEGNSANGNVATTSTTPGTVHITSELVEKKDQQQLTIEDGCLQLPGVDGTGLISNEVFRDVSATTISSIELDNSGRGSILVLADPSQLAALQQIAVTEASSDVKLDNEGVQLIRLEDFASEEDGNLTENLIDPFENKNKRKLIVIKELDVKDEKM